MMMNVRRGAVAMSNHLLRQCIRAVALLGRHDKAHGVSHHRMSVTFTVAHVAGFLHC